MSLENNPSSSKTCCFCNITEDNELEYGKFYEHDGIVTHYYCLLLSSNMEQKGNDDEGILGFLTDDIHKEIRRGKRLACCYCKKVGATLGCCNSKCKRIFHYPCGLKAGSLHQFFGEFRSYCINHRPKQNVDDILKQIGSQNEIVCYICYDKINYRDCIKSLWAPCCKKNAWFHRQCVQQLAISTGYFFKCPLCNDKEIFRKAMLKYGIFIPNQDASWELIPNAFEELLYRYDQCDAIKCLCPKGRKHKSSNAKWELALCRTCGSQGIHTACGNLKWGKPVWECRECIRILHNSKDHGNGSLDNTSSECNQRKGYNSDSSIDFDFDLDTSDSDTDISVGTDFPVPRSLSPEPSFSIFLDSNIKLRPGPRFYKLQQIKANNIATCKLGLSQNIAEKNIDIEASLKNIDKLSSENDSKRALLTVKTNKFQQKKMLPSNSEKFKPQPEEIIIDDDEDDIQIIKIIPRADFTKQTKGSNMLNMKNAISESTTTLSNFSKADDIMSRKSGDYTVNNNSVNSGSIYTNTDSIMNRGINNITSTKPEIVAGVSDVRSKQNDALLRGNDIKMSALVDHRLEKDFVSHSSLKRSMHEEDRNCKKFKGNDLNEAFTDSCNVVTRRSTRQYNQTMPALTPALSQSKCNELLTGKNTVIKDSSKSTTSANCISNGLLTYNNKKNDLFRPFLPEDIKCTNKSNYLKGTDALQIDVQQNDESCMIYPLNQDSKKRYAQYSEKLFTSKPTSNLNFTNCQSRGNVTNILHVTTYNGNPQQMTNNTQVNKQKILNANKLVTTDITTAIKQMTVVNKQETNLAKEKLLKNKPSSSNGSINKIVCDGDPDISFVDTAKPTCSFEIDQSSKRKDSLKTNTCQSTSWKSFKQKIFNKTDTVMSYRLDGTTCSLFPRITNNHNTCYQPRLIPQYMHLDDLKFRVCGADNVQMILYDTFSVNISVKNSTKNKSKSNITDCESDGEEFTLSSQAENEVSSSSDYIDRTRITECMDKSRRITKNEDYLNNDKIKSAVNVVGVVADRDHDETKENLDPIFKTVSHNNISDNINLPNDIDNILNNDYTYIDNHNQISLVSTGDINSTTLNRTICDTRLDTTNTSLDNTEGTTIYCKQLHSRFTN